MNSAEAETLLNKAVQKKLTLMSGHVFLYNPGIMKLKETLDNNLCGPVQYITAIRSNLGPFRYDTNAAWDLASHDLYIFSHLLGLHAEAVSCHGGYFLQQSHADVCFLGLRYKTNILGSIHVSWLNPTKIREIVVVCKDKMIKWNELDSEGPIKIYHSTVKRQEFMEYGTFLLSAKTEDIIIPKVKPAEPLSLQNLSFLEHAKSGKIPVDAGADPIAVIRQLEAADQSLKENSQFINVRSE
jgi:predicted dehydrogenase